MSIHRKKVQVLSCVRLIRKRCLKNVSSFIWMRISYGNIWENMCFSCVFVRMRKKPSCISSCNKSLESTHKFWWNYDEYLNRIVQLYGFYRICRIWKAANRKFDQSQKICKADSDFIVLFYRYELYATLPRRFVIGCRSKNIDLRPITKIIQIKSRDF